MNLIQIIKFHRLRRPYLTLVVTCLITLLATGCEIYRYDVYQGQDSAIEEVENIEVGMTRSEIIEIMGTPLVVDRFRDNRWDYIFSVAEKGTKAQVKLRVTLFFEDDKLVKIVETDNRSEEELMDELAEEATDQVSEEIVESTEESVAETSEDSNDQSTEESSDQTDEEKPDDSDDKPKKKSKFWNWLTGGDQE